MTLTIKTCGTNLLTTEREAGIAAAEAVFKASRYDAKYCAENMQYLSDGEDHDAEAVYVWLDAESAAIEAACAGWAQIPEGLSLELEAR